MKNLFVISDIHGQMTQLKELIQHWNPKKEKLVIAGDMVDRGENPYEVVHYIQELIKQYPEDIAVIKGNHEEMFLRWLDAPTHSSFHYIRYGGLQTVESFLQQTKNEPDYSSGELMSTVIVEEFSEMVEFLRSLPLYYEHGKYVVVHAGVNLSPTEDWRESKDPVMLWIREDFFGEHVPNLTNKIFIFGHTPTHGIYKGASTDIWISNCQTKIGIDGGAVYGGTLNGLKIDVETGQYHSIQIKHPYLEEYLDED